ncbi:30S ribosome-binding factor RbfA [Patescibacteria group bacterium]|nr:30S ribosome-binding factor RbfA [Patescibacteria group bacterium]
MKRLEKVNELIKEELAKIIDRMIEFPEGALVTVTRVEVSEDKLYANAFFSLLSARGNGISEIEILNLLKKTVYAIQQALNKKLRIRPVPKIRFFIDEAEKKRERIEELLSGLEEQS